MSPRHPLYGFLAEFPDEHALLHAVHAARAEGYQLMEAYTPMPVEEIAHALGHKNRMPLVVLIGGIVGAVGGYWMQHWTMAIDYPLNVGGRPLASWPSYIVVTFEMAVLFAALACVLGLLALCGLPRPYHPVFNVPMFELASRNRFFLMILSRDARFDPAATARFLESQHPITVAPVPR